MARISALPILGAPDGTEKLPVVRAGRTLQTPVAAVVAPAVAAAVAPHVEAAQLAAATALAASRYFPSRATGEAASAADQLFSTHDGAGKRG